jgi:hypothetical protein
MEVGDERHIHFRARPLDPKPCRAILGQDNIDVLAPKKSHHTAGILARNRNPERLAHTAPKRAGGQRLRQQEAAFVDPLSASSGNPNQRVLLSGYPVDMRPKKAFRGTKAALFLAHCNADA